jgi:rRNA maturation RNase YbeY
METLIQFFYEEVDFSLEHENVVHDWVLNSIRKEGLQAGVINVIFCSDEYLLDLNQRFLDRDTFTDVISFDYGEGGNDVSGDVFISYDRITENAEKFDISIEKELMRVIIHGILHLCGYADSNTEEKAVMTSKEDKYLSLLPQ